MDTQAKSNQDSVSEYTRGDEIMNTLHTAVWGSVLERFKKQQQQQSNRLPQAG
jgi:AICAR transformylase/IMP cyclohydrolase PurH